MPLVGWAFSIDADGVPPAEVTAPNVFFVERSPLVETEAEATARMRAGGGLRMSLDELKNIVGQPRALLLSGLTAVATSDKRITASWSKYPLAAGYDVRWSADGAIWTDLPSQAGLSIVLSGLTGGTPYQLQVRPKSKEGVVLSAYVNVAVTTLPGLEALPGTKATTHFSAIKKLGYNLVTDLSGVHVGNIVIKSSKALEMQLSIADGLVADLAMANPGKFNALIAADQEYIPGSPTYDNRWRIDAASAGDKGVIAGLTYSLRFRDPADRSVYDEYTFTPVPSSDPLVIYSADTAVTGSGSVQVLNLVRFSVYTKPVAPTELTLVPSSMGTSVAIGWKASAAATGYWLQRRKNGETNWTTVQGNLQATSFTDGGLTATTLYAYRVFSLENGVVSDDSAMGSTTTGSGGGGGLIASLAGRRSMALNMYLYGTASDGRALAQDIDYLRFSVDELHCNVVQFNLNWEQIENGTDGTYDWRKIDHIAGVAASLGLGIVWRFAMKRSPGFNTKSNGQQWIPDPEGAYDSEGNLYVAGDARIASFSSSIMRAKTFEFVRAAISHIMSQPYGVNTVLWSLTPNGRYEFGYDWVNTVGGKEGVITNYDFGARAQQDFVTWAQAHYGSITNANNKWKTSFTNYGEVRLPKPTMYDAKNEYYAYSSDFQIDSYRFREERLAEWITDFAGVVRAMLSGAEIAYEEGSTFDLRSSQRCSVTMPGRLSSINCIKQNGAADYTPDRIRMSTCISKQDWTPGRVAADEIGFDHDPSAQAQRIYMQLFYEAGGNFLSIANYEWPFFTVDQIKQRLRDLVGSDMASVLATTPQTTSDGTFTISARVLARDGWNNSSPQAFVQFKAVSGNFKKVIYDYSTY